MKEGRFVLEFLAEKTTKNTQRYQELTDGSPAVIGPLYVQKWALQALSGTSALPERLRVTVEAEPGDE